MSSTIRRSQLRYFGQVIRISQGKLAMLVFWVAPTGQTTQRPGKDQVTWLHLYLSWMRLAMEPEEPSDAAEDRLEFRDHLGRAFSTGGRCPSTGGRLRKAGTKMSESKRVCRPACPNRGSVPSRSHEAFAGEPRAENYTKPKLTHKGDTHFLNTILDVCSNRVAKHDMGGTDFKWSGQAPLSPPQATALTLMLNQTSFTKHKVVARDWGTQTEMAKQKVIYPHSWPFTNRQSV